MSYYFEKKSLLRLLRSHSLTAALCAFVGVSEKLETLAFLVISGIAVKVLSALLPLVALGFDSAAQLMVLRDSPSWQVTMVEKASLPTRHSLRMALWCLWLNTLVGTLPEGMVVTLPSFTQGFGPVAGHRVFRVKDFVHQCGLLSERLWLTLSSVLMAKYLLDIKSPPRVVDEYTALPGTWSHTVERYYRALRDPRKFNDEKFADMASTISRVLTAVIFVLSTLPWFAFFGVGPSQVSSAQRLQIKGYNIQSPRSVLQLGVSEMVPKMIPKMESKMVPKMIK